MQGRYAASYEARALKEIKDVERMQGGGYGEASRRVGSGGKHRLSSKKKKEEKKSMFCWRDEGGSGSKKMAEREG